MGEPGGRPQIVSFVPLRNRFVCTVNANQLVLLRFVLNSGLTDQFVAPVEVKTRLELTEKLRIWMVGGGGGSEVTISPRMLSP